MKTASHSFRFAVAGGIISLLQTVTAATIIDKFNDPSAWGDVFKFDAKSDIFVGNGRLNYTSSTTREAGAVIFRRSPLLPTNKDWSIQVDAHIDPFKLTKQNQFSDLFLGIGKTDDWRNTNVKFEFCRGKWGPEPDDYDIQDNMDVNGRDMPNLFVKEGLDSPNVSLRMDFSAAKQTITYLFDGDGPAGGYQWVKQGTMVVDGGRYDLKMTSKDTFTIMLVGSSERQKVAKSQAWLDNLRITVGNASNLAVQQPAGSDLTAGESRKSFGTHPVGGSGLTRTFTLRNDGAEALTGIRINTDGTNAADFKASLPAATTLAPGETTTFKITFKPSASGTRSASVHIRSNDQDESPFAIKLSGMGVE